MSENAGYVADIMHKIAGCPVIIFDKDHVVATAGVPRKEFAERRVTGQLEELMENRGQALRKETIFNAVWGSSCFSELSSLSVYISWLRDKIEDDPKNPKLIKTVYKIGYQFGE